MGFLIQCDNKGCHKTMEPILDTSDNEVYCTECSNSIKSVTSFAKVQMKNLGQTKKAGGNTQTAFSLVCPECAVKATPIVNKNKIYCGACKVCLEDKISKPILQGIRYTLSGKSE